MSLSKVKKRNRIKKRVRGLVSGTAERPRLTVYKSNKEIYAQLVDDSNSKTLASFSSKSKDANKDGTKVEQASSVGLKIAEIAKKSKISTVVFDRNGFIYHGRIKALAEGAREGGLKF